MNDSFLQRLEAIREIQSVLIVLLSADQATLIDEQISEVLQKGPNELDILRLINVFHEYQALEKFYSEILDEYQSTDQKPVKEIVDHAGRPTAIPPGPCYRCPQDPFGCPPRYLRVEGQRLRCLRHHIDMIPEKQVNLPDQSDQSEAE